MNISSKRWETNSGYGLIILLLICVVFCKQTIADTGNIINWFPSIRPIFSFNQEPLWVLQHSIGFYPENVCTPRPRKTIFVSPLYLGIPLPPEVPGKK